MSRGYFEIGIYNSKTPANIGTLWRSAYQLGAAGIFCIGPRCEIRQKSDTTAAHRHIPMRFFESFESFLLSIPHGSPLVGVEMGGVDIAGYAHPARAIYLLGAEDSGLPPHILSACDATISLRSVRTQSYNVAVAGSIVMYHRMFM